MKTLARKITVIVLATMMTICCIMVGTTSYSYAASGTSIQTTNAAGLKSSVPKKVADIYEKSGLRIIIDKTCKYAGKFNLTTGITLKSSNKSVFRHEMGHFLSALKNNAAKSSAFVKIYKAEKNKRTTSAYGKQNSDEYFAESYKDYLNRAKVLKKDRPRTYKYMVKLSRDISEKDLANKWWSAA